jgi:hypothetical protein
VCSCLPYSISTLCLSLKILIQKYLRFACIEKEKKKKKNIPSDPIHLAALSLPDFFQPRAPLCRRPSPLLTGSLSPSSSSSASSPSRAFLQLAELHGSPLCATLRALLQAATPWTSLPPSPSPCCACRILACGAPFLSQLPLSTPKLLVLQSASRPSLLVVPYSLVPELPLRAKVAALRVACSTVPSSPLRVAPHLHGRRCRCFSLSPPWPRLAEVPAAACSPRAPCSPARSQWAFPVVHVVSPPSTPGVFPSSDLVSHRSLVRVSVGVVEFCLVGLSSTSPVVVIRRRVVCAATSLIPPWCLSTNFASSIPRLRSSLDSCPC